MMATSSGLRPTILCGRQSGQRVCLMPCMSNAWHLFDLVLMLKQATREHEVYIHCFHISEDRMIASGVDGLSRGNYDSGISLGYDVCQFLPLNISAWDVAGNVLAD